MFQKGDGDGGRNFQNTVPLLIKYLLSIYLCKALVIEAVG